MEEKPIFQKPIFQFKKLTSRKIGDFDVNDKSEFTLLIKYQYQDFPKFLHFRKLWNVEETQDQVDPDGNVVKKGVKAAPAYEVTMGFIRDDKFIIQDQKQVSKRNYTEIHKVYMASLKSYVDSGWIKDVNLYSGNEVKIPPYYVNEKTSFQKAQEAMIQSIMRGQKAVAQASNPQAQMAVGGTKNPLLKLMLPKKSSTNP